MCKTSSEKWAATVKMAAWNCSLNAQRGTSDELCWPEAVEKGGTV